MKFRARTFKRITKARPEAGFTMLYIVLFGVYSSITIAMLYPIVLGALRSEAANRNSNELRNAAETGIDFGLNYLNLNPTTATSAGSINVPSVMTPSFPNGTVKIQIRDITPADLNSPNLSAKSGWKILESTAKRGILAKSVRVFLSPNSYNDSTPGIVYTNSQSNISYFANAFLANGVLSISSASLKKGSGGSDYVAKSAKEILIPATTQLEGFLQAPKLPNFYSARPGDQAIPTITAVNSPPATQVQPLVFPSVDSQPGSSLMGGNYTSQNPVPQSNELPLTINANPETPVKIFVQDGADLSNTNAMTIQANGIKNSGLPSNLQIWYDGAKDINIELSSNNTFNALIYAPNANITLKNPGTFNGALVGNNVTASDASDITIDTSVENSTNMANIKAGLTFSKFRDENLAMTNGFKVENWTEIQGIVVK